MNHPETKECIEISEKWNTGQNTSHVLCCYSLDAGETIYETQYLATTWQKQVKQQATKEQQKQQKRMHWYDIVQE